MKTFVDTSALYALLDEDDDNHSGAAAWLLSAGPDETDVLVTHSYIVVETAALVQRRLGAAAVRTLFDAILPALTVVFVDDVLHRRAFEGTCPSSTGSAFSSCETRISIERLPSAATFGTRVSPSCREHNGRAFDQHRGVRIVTPRTASVDR